MNKYRAQEIAALDDACRLRNIEDKLVIFTRDVARHCDEDTTNTPQKGWIGRIVTTDDITEVDPEEKYYTTDWMDFEITWTNDEKGNEINSFSWWVNHTDIMMISDLSEVELENYGIVKRNIKIAIKTNKKELYSDDD